MELLGEEEEQILSFVNKGSYKRVALQFPDDLLKLAPNLVLRLQQRSSDCQWFILGDTSYGSCCIDLVAAQHVKADCMIHFGVCCLSVPSSVPVLLLFPKNALPDLPEVLPCQGMTLVYHVSLHHHVEELKRYCAKHSLKLAEIQTQYVNQKEQAIEKEKLMGRVISNECTGILYVTPLVEDDLSVLLALEYYGDEKKELFVCSPKSSLIKMRDLVSSAFFSKRRMMIERGRKEKAIGVLCGTTSKDRMAEHLKNVVQNVRKANKTPYSLVVGKINAEKLLNFSNLTVFVLLGCPMNTMVISKRFSNSMCNIITPQEFLYCYAKEWMPRYSLSDPLDQENEIEQEEEAKSKEQQSISKVSGKELVLKESPAALFMHSNNRWIGVNPSVEHESVKEPEEGRAGIASGYEDEYSIPKPKPFVKKEKKIVESEKEIQRRKLEEKKKEEEIRDKEDKGELMEGLGELF